MSIHTDGESRPGEGVIERYQAKAMICCNGKMQAVSGTQPGCVLVRKPSGCSEIEAMDLKTACTSALCAGMS